MSTTTKERTGQALQRDGASSVEGETLDELIQRLDSENVHWSIAAKVEKFDLDAIAKARAFFNSPDDVEPVGWQLQAAAAPYETVVEEGNLLVRQGLRRLMDRLFGTASNQAMDATHARIGTGDDATAAAATNTDLTAAAGSTHRQFQLVDSGTVGTGASSGVMTYVATFGTGVGNYHWQEWGLDGGTASGTTVTTEGNTTPGLFNHKVTDLGTKTSAASWVFTITITIT